MKYPGQCSPITFTHITSLRDNENLTNVALNMLKRNRPIEEIADITGLSLDEIEKLSH